MTPNMPPSELVASINHQLRTPMTKLLCHAELIQSRAAEMPADISDSVAAIVLATTQLDDSLRWASEVVQGLFPAEPDRAESSDHPVASSLH